MLSRMGRLRQREDTALRYKAFLSYSHAADGNLAPAVQAALHRIARPWYRVRSIWVFRDKTGLSATPSLWGTIQAALSESEYFLLMASPEAAASKWVQQEVEWWLSKWSTKNMLVLLTDGEIQWDASAKDWDWSRTTALPQNLRGRTEEEFLWVDLRWARSEENLSLRHSQFRAAILDIAATLLGRAKESLDSEDVRVYRRNRSAAYASVVVSLLLAAGAVTGAFLANQQRARATNEARRADTEAARAKRNADEATKQKNAALAANVVAEQRRREAERQARIANSGRLAATALLQKSAQFDLFSLLAAEAYRTAPTFEARNALLGALQANGRLAAYLHHPAAMHSAAFSPNGRILATGGADGIIRFWDVASRRVIREGFQGQKQAITKLAFRPDGKVLVCATDKDSALRVWDLDSGKPIGEPLMDNFVEEDMAFSPDGKLFASVVPPGIVRIWDAHSWRVLEDLNEAKNFAGAIAFSPDGKVLAMEVRYDIRFVDLATRQPIGPSIDTSSVTKDAIVCLAFSPDGKTLATAATNRVQLWDVSTRQAVGSAIIGDELYHVRTVGFSPDGNRLAIANQNFTVQLWDIALQYGEPLAAHREGIWGAYFSPDGKLLASVGDDGVLLWRVNDRSTLSSSLQAKTKLNGLAFSPDGNVLAAAGDDNTVQFWDPRSRKRLPYGLRGHPGRVLKVAFSPDGRTIVSGDSEGLIGIWDGHSLKSTGRLLRADMHAVMDLAIHPGGGMIAVASDRLRILDTATHQMAGQAKIDAYGVYSVAFSPDGKMLAASGGDGEIRIWDMTADPLLGHWFRLVEGGNGGASSLAFSPDNKILAIASGFKIQLWDIVHRQLLGEPLTGHRDYILSLAFSPNGETLVSGGRDQTVRLWDVASQQPLGEEFDGHGGEVQAVAFSPDGKMVASASSDETIRLWDVDPISWSSRVCTRANRNLSLAEWRHYLGGDTYQRTCPSLLGEGEGSKPIFSARQ